MGGRGARVHTHNLTQENAILSSPSYSTQVQPSPWVESKLEMWEVNWVRSVLSHELVHSRSRNCKCSKIATSAIAIANVMTQLNSWATSCSMAMSYTLSLSEECSLATQDYALVYLCAWHYASPRPSQHHVCIKEVVKLDIVGRLMSIYMWLNIRRLWFTAMAWLFFTGRFVKEVREIIIHSSCAVQMGHSQDYMLIWYTDWHQSNGDFTFTVSYIHHRP